MRCLACRLAAVAVVTLAAAVPARAQDPPASPDPPASLSLTVRVTPAYAWSAIGNLRQLMSDGPQSEAGPLLLRNLLGIISAEVAIERGPRTPPASAGIRASSDPLTRAVQEGGVGAARDRWTKEQQRIDRQAAASGLSLDGVVSGTARALESQAHLARQGADAIAAGLAGLKAAWSARPPRPRDDPGSRAPEPPPAEPR